jgi:hypothetical protein
LLEHLASKLPLFRFNRYNLGRFQRHAVFSLNNCSVRRSSRCAYVPSVSRKENGSTFMCRDAPERPIYHRSETASITCFQSLAAILNRGTVH